MLDEQGTGKSFIAGIRAEKMAGNMEKQELEQSSVEKTHREQRRKLSRLGMDKPH